MANDRRFVPEAPEAYDATDPKAEKKAKAAVAQRNADNQAVVVSLLATREGRQWVLQVLRDTGLFKDRIITDGEYANGFSDGQRETGFSLMRIFCAADPAKFALMVQEQDAYV